jgi:DNA-directed RNA polymerase specialized sigma24 family protein
VPTGDVLAFSRKDSFEAVVLPHLDAAHNLARWLMRDTEAAEDVLQDSIVRALTYFPTVNWTSAATALSGRATARAIAEMNKPATRMFRGVWCSMSSTCGLKP